MLLTYCLKVKVDVNLKLFSCVSVKSKKKHKLKKQRETFYPLDNHRLMIRKTQVTMDFLLGFIFMAEFSPFTFLSPLSTSTLATVLALVQGSCFPSHSLDISFSSMADILFKSLCLSFSLGKLINLHFLAWTEMAASSV